MAVLTQSAPLRMRRSALHLAIAAGLAATLGHADARITKVTIDSRATAFGGYAWPGVGQYEKITGWAYGELDPNDAHNAVITDIKLAPRNANGKVEYSHNFYILKPLDLANGNHKVVYDAVNRGVEDIQRPQPRLERRRSRLGDRRAGAVAARSCFRKATRYVASGWDASAGTSPAN